MAGVCYVYPRTASVLRYCHDRGYGKYCDNDLCIALLLSGAYALLVLSSCLLKLELLLCSFFFDCKLIINFTL